MERINAGYRIVESVRLDNCNEIVIGEAVSKTRPAQYVCWDCTDGDNYNNGGYCDTYRQALNVLSERITRRYDFLPLRAPEESVRDRRIKLLSSLTEGRYPIDWGCDKVRCSGIIYTSPDESEAPSCIQEALAPILSDMFCDTKFDPSILFDELKSIGFTREDLEFFGIIKWYNENNEEGDTADDYLC